jgi:GrpB-like predicted nucleotidyltransferase (UPF0157 family)
MLTRAASLYPRCVRRIVEVVDHDPSWATAFAEERARIAAVPLGTVVEHIGSTSVPGLPAKPTLDIMIVSGQLSLVLPALESIGYEYRPGSFAEDPAHYFLRRVRGGVRTHHVHLLERNSPRVGQYRLFRDYLIATPAAVTLYADAKRDLIARHGDDRAAYLAEKPAVVEELMRRAGQWAADQR